MELLIDFPGGERVDAHFGPYTVMTDQPRRDGTLASAPAPFALFLASLGTCAGIYVHGFCAQRGLPTDGIRLLQRVASDPATGKVSKIDIEIQVPPSIPEKYHAALIRSADQCKVKKLIENPPEFEVSTRVVE